MMSGLKSQVNSFKERLKNNKTNRDQPVNPREAMRNGESKKVIFGSMIETTGGDQSDHFLAKGGMERNPRGAMKQSSGAKARGMSQAPSLMQKKLDGQEAKASAKSKLLQSR